MAAGRKTGGRRPGSKNLKTKEREAAAAQAQAAVSARLASSGALPYDDKISPKDVILRTMRDAWHDHQVLKERAILAHGVAEQAKEDAQRMTPVDGETADAFEARKKQALATATKALEAASAAKMAATGVQTLYLDCAQKAAPYEHAKLQTSTIQGEMELTVNIKQYGKAKP